MSASLSQEEASPPQQQEPSLQGLGQQNAHANSAENGISGNESRPVLLPAKRDNGTPQDAAHSQSLPDEKRAKIPASHVSKRPSFWQRLLLDTWFPEGIAASFSVVCIAAIVGVLLAYDRDKSPQFPYGLTLNAIISILAIGSKSSLLFVMAEVLSQLKWCWFTRSRRLEDIQTFDNASRGSWGSVTMLRRLYQAPLGSATALVIMLALAFEPFLQQASVTRAEECAITPCARDYEVHVQNGIPKVHVTGINYGLIGYQWIYGNKYENLCWKPEPGNVTSAPVPPENTSQDISFSQVYRNETSHAYCSLDVYQGIIQQAFDTSVTCVNKREYKSGHGVLDNCQDSDEYALLSLVKDHGLSRVINNVAASLTKLALDQSGETITGNANATTPKVYVQVEREWLTLPLALEMAAIVFFLATVFVNRRKAVRLWKLSLLPITYHDFAQEKLNMEAAIAEVSGMEIMAREAIARLDARKTPAL